MHPVPAALVPRFGSTWRHYKGGMYAVIVVAEHTETKEPMVVYQHEESGKVYTRPLAMWYGDVGEGRTRFTAVPEQWGGEGPMEGRCIRTNVSEQQTWPIRPSPAP